MSPTPALSLAQLLHDERQWTRGVLIASLDRFDGIHDGVISAFDSLASIAEGADPSAVAGNTPAAPRRTSGSLREVLVEAAQRAHLADADALAATLQIVLEGSVLAAADGDRAAILHGRRLIEDLFARHLLTSLPVSDSAGETADIDWMTEYGVELGDTVAAVRRRVGSSDSAAETWISSTHDDDDVDLVAAGDAQYDLDELDGMYADHDSSDLAGSDTGSLVGPIVQLDGFYDADDLYDSHDQDLVGVEPCDTGTGVERVGVELVGVELGDQRDVA